MKKSIPCQACEGRGCNTVMTGVRGDYCGVMNESCPECNGTGVKLVDMTNADRIRAMDDEDLAEVLLLFNHLECRIPFCKNLPQCEELLDTEEGVPEEKCKQCLLDWLRQPAETPNKV